MGQIYFPSCNFSAASPAAAKKIRDYMEAKMPVAECCRTDRLPYPEGSQAIYFCQACRETLEARADGRYIMKNLFEVLVEDECFLWPDHTGLTVTVQDCWRDREHPEIFAAVRTALGKMNIEIIEMTENMEKSRFCGNLHFDGRPLLELSEEEQAVWMRKQVEKFPVETAVTYCNRCTRGIKAGGGKAVHLLELAMDTYK